MHDWMEKRHSLPEPHEGLGVRLPIDWPKMAQTLWQLIYLTVAILFEKWRL